MKELLFTRQNGIPFHHEDRRATDREACVAQTGLGAAETHLENPGQSVVQARWV
jgi:hypothetical protein